MYPIPDGSLDIAAANDDSDSVTVLMQDGMGTFGRSANYRTGDHPFAVAIVDVDGDSANDLIVANFNSASLSFLRNQGRGSMDPSVSLAVGAEPSAITVEGTVAGAARIFVPLAGQDAIAVLPIGCFDRPNSLDR